VTTARLLTERPLVEFNDEGLRVLKRELAVDLGCHIVELHEWGGTCVSTSPDGTTMLIVPSGFVYNGASIPSLLLLHSVMGDRELYEAAGVFHDFLYREQAPRSTSDFVFWLIARSGSKQVTPARGWFGWAGLRIGGWIAYRARGREAAA